MVNGNLPKTLNPFKFAAKQQVLTGKLALNQMKRLVSVCQMEELEGFVEFQLKGRMQQEVKLLEGSLETKVNLICQRCLEPFVYEVKAGIELAPVSSEKEAEEMTSAYEPLLVQEETIAILTLIEDELLLNLPTVALHPLEACEVDAANWRFGESNQSEFDETRQKPFAQLADLKKRKQ